MKNGKVISKSEIKQHKFNVSNEKSHHINVLTEIYDENYWTKDRIDHINHLLIHLNGFDYLFRKSPKRGFKVLHTIEASSLIKMLTKYFSKKIIFNISIPDYKKPNRETLKYFYGSALSVQWIGALSKMLDRSSETSKLLNELRGRGFKVELYHHTDYECMILIKYPDVQMIKVKNPNV